MKIWTLKRPVATHVGIRKIIMPLTRPKILTTFTVLAQLNSSLHQIHNFTMHSLNHRPKVKKNHLVSWINKDKGWPGFSFIKQGPGWNMLRAKGSGMGFLGSSNLYHLSKFTRTWLYITTNDHDHSERWKACVQRRPLAEQANDQQQNMLVPYNHAYMDIGVVGKWLDFITWFVLFSFISSFSLSLVISKSFFREILLSFRIS